MPEKTIEQQVEEVKRKDFVIQDPMDYMGQVVKEQKDLDEKQKKEKIEEGEEKDVDEEEQEDVDESKDSTKDSTEEGIIEDSSKEDSSTQEDSSNESSKSSESTEITTETTAEAEDVTTKIERGATRDLSDFAEEHHQHLRKMGNQAFAHVGEILKQRKVEQEELVVVQAKVTDLEKGIVSSYQEHPQAFVLTPKYSSLVAEESEITSHITHWERQKSLIAAGKQWVNLEMVGNQLVNSAPKDPSDEDGIAINAKLLELKGKIQHIGDQAQQLGAAHKERHISYLAGIKSFAQKAFPQFDDSSNEPAKKALLKSEGEAKAAGLEGNPLAPLFARSFATIELQAQIIKDLKETSATVRKKKRKDLATVKQKADKILESASTTSIIKNKPSSSAEDGWGTVEYSSFES